MKGYELIKKIQDGEIDNCKVKWKVNGDHGTERTIEIKCGSIIWEPGEFSTKELTSKYIDFEVINEQIDIHAIEELDARFNGDSNLVRTDIYTINLLVKAVKDLDFRLNAIK